MMIARAGEKVSSSHIKEEGREIRNIFFYTKATF